MRIETIRKSSFMLVGLTKASLNDDCGLYFSCFENRHDNWVYSVVETTFADV